MTHNPMTPALATVTPTDGAAPLTKYNHIAARNALNDAATLNAAMSQHTLALGAQIGAKTQDSTFNEELAARNIAQSQDTNAAIMQVEIVCQSAIGSFAFKDGSHPYLTDRDQLWRKHVRNCCASYCEKGGRALWQDKESCALLSSSDFLLGIQSSPGTQYPVTFDIKIKFANRAAYRGGACYSTGQTKGQMIFEDVLIGTPVVVGLFHSNVLTLSSSAGVLSSQSFSQATTAAALASS